MDGPQAKAEQTREYVLSELQNGRIAAAFALILEQAPKLGEAELRVLMCLTQLFVLDENASGRIGSRELAEKVKLARPNVQKAIDSLERRALIAVRPGTATTKTGFGLVFLQVKQMGGGIFTMPPPEEIPPLFRNLVASSQSQGGSFSMPPPTENEFGVASSQSQGGSFSMPPDLQQWPAPARGLDFKIDSDSIIDRVLRAKPAFFDSKELDEAKRWVQGYNLKFGADRNILPPNDETMAELLSVAPLGRIIRLVQDLTVEIPRKQPGTSPKWWVTVALDRIHGIRPEVLKEARADLRIARKPSPPAPEQQKLIDEQTRDPKFSGELVDDVLDGMRKRRAKGAKA